MGTTNIKNILQALPVSALILLYAYTVFSKLGDFEEFRGQLHNQNFSPFFADTLSILLPAVETFTVGLLLYSGTLRQGLILSLALLVVFTGYIALVKLGLWDRVPCSCGGILNQMSWTVHLIFNIVLLLINLLAIRIEK